jgi:hypothetical protein
MSDEIILKFLDRNYELKTDKNSFIIFGKKSEESFSLIEFNEHFIKIFSDFNVDTDKSSITILHSWLSNKKRVITKVLYDLFDNLDIAERSQKQLTEALKLCDKKHKNIFNVEFITNLFLDYYYDKHITPKLIEYIKSFNCELGSKNLIDGFDVILMNEHPKLIRDSIDYMNKWYSNTFMGSKVKNILSELVITLGSRNWVVTWVGHGQLNKERFLDIFKNEDGYHHKFILDMYDKWFEETVEHVSNRIMGINT